MERFLVTGASRGIGLEYVRQLAGRGDRVFAGCRAPAHAEALQALAARHPHGVIPLALDVRDDDSIDAALRSVADDGPGTLDVLVNNAGVSPRGEEFSNLDSSAMLDVYAVNSIAPLIVAQRARPLLGGASRPRVANMSSSMGSLEKKTYGRHYSYASSKAALNMLTRAAAHDLADDGIIVVALHPGWVRTDLGGPHAELPVEESVGGLLQVIDGLSSGQSSQFLTWRGERHPW